MHLRAQRVRKQRVREQRGRARRRIRSSLTCEHSVPVHARFSFLTWMWMYSAHDA